MPLSPRVVQCDDPGHLLQVKLGLCSQKNIRESGHWVRYLYIFVTHIGLFSEGCRYF